MTIEGNWIAGAMTNDYPDVDYIVAELPEGPAGKGTLQFTNCWGMAADSPNQEAALDLVEYLTSTEQQLAFSKAFGADAVDPVGRRSVEQRQPGLHVAFLAGADYAQAVPTTDGIADVITDFNSELEGLKTGDPQEILDTSRRTSKRSSAERHVRPRPMAPRRARSPRSGIRRGEGLGRVALHRPRAHHPRRLPASSRS